MVQKDPGSKNVQVCAQKRERKNKSKGIIIAVQTNDIESSLADDNTSSALSLTLLQSQAYGWV